MSESRQIVRRKLTDPERRPQRIVLGQAVQPAKAELARYFRRALTPEEALLWQRLRAGQLEGWHFRRQQVIAGFIVDFYCHAAGLAVEVDGAQHQEMREYDEERDRILGLRGVRVLRFANAEVRSSIDDVLKRIVAACESAAR